MFILFFYRVQHEYYAHEPCNNTVDETSLVHGGVKVFCLKTVVYGKGIIPDQYDLALTARSCHVHKGGFPVTQDLFWYPEFFQEILLLFEV